MLSQVVVGVLRAALAFSRRRAEGVDAPVPGAGGVPARTLLRVGREAALLFQQLAHQFLIPRLVEPLVQPVEFVLLAVGRIAGLELLRLLSVPRSQSIPRRAHCHLLLVQPIPPAVHLVRKPQIVARPVLVKRLRGQVGVRRLGLLLGTQRSSICGLRGRAGTQCPNTFCRPLAAFPILFCRFRGVAFPQSPNFLRRPCHYSTPAFSNASEISLSLYPFWLIMFAIAQAL